MSRARGFPACPVMLDDRALGYSGGVLDHPPALGSAYREPSSTRSLRSLHWAGHPDPTRPALACQPVRTGPSRLRSSLLRRPLRGAAHLCSSGGSREIIISFIIFLFNPMLEERTARGGRKRESNSAGLKRRPTEREGRALPRRGQLSWPVA